MNISCSIDVCNVDQLEAAVAFMRVLGGHGIKVETSPTIANTEGTPLEAIGQKPTRTKKTPVLVNDPESVQVLPAAVEETKTETPAAEPQVVEKTEAKGIDVEYLRGRVGDIMKADGTKREDIKAKLRELGAESVSSLDPSNFSAFNEYLETLY